MGERGELSQKDRRRHKQAQEGTSVISFEVQGLADFLSIR